jgi:RimJ/RimL family protein N-acetyltransferase
LPELAGHGVILTPTTLHDAPDLAAAASSAAPDAFRWTFVPRTADEWRATIAENTAMGRLIYTVRAGGDEAVVGTTGFYDLDFWSGRSAPDACEVGHTWYVPAVRGTTVNPACKLMLFALAFDTWRVTRIAMRTDARNAASRAAMLKLGMTYEGTRRRHMPGADGTIRDSSYFSALPTEWAAIRRALEARLA